MEQKDKHQNDRIKELEADVMSLQNQINQLDFEADLSESSIASLEMEVGCTSDTWEEGSACLILLPDVPDLAVLHICEIEKSLGELIVQKGLLGAIKYIDKGID